MYYLCRCVCVFAFANIHVWWIIMISFYKGVCICIALEVLRWMRAIFIINSMKVKEIGILLKVTLKCLWSCFFVSIKLPFWVISHWCGLIYLGFFTWHNVFEVHPCANTHQKAGSFHYWIRIPLSAYTTYCLPIYELMKIAVLFIFWLLWIKWLWAFFVEVFGQKLPVVLGRYLRVARLDHMVLHC